MAYRHESTGRQERIDSPYRLEKSLELSFLKDAGLFDEAASEAIEIVDERVRHNKVVLGFCVPTCTHARGPLP